MKLRFDHSEGVTLISEETSDQLLDTFDNIEQEEFFEVEAYSFSFVLSIILKLF